MLNYLKKEHLLTYEVQFPSYIYHLKLLINHQ
nr:MAG TPA: hypothetical protein [Caudoviricetes sp.]